MIDNLVIGSGPSGISVAYALASTGRKVTILDAGYSLEKERRQQIKSLVNKDIDEWEDTDEIFKGNIGISISGVSEKRHFGSDYSTKHSELFQIKKENSFFYTSLAKGGLSNVWGRGIEPLIENDTSRWPFTYAQLKPYYKKVLQFMPLSGCKDSLEHLYPLFTENYNEPRLSAQATFIHNKFNMNQAELGSLGLIGGISRISAKYNGGWRDCNGCGKCLYGCPYDLLYTSSQTLDHLISEGKVNYIPGFIVDSIDEDRNIVKIKCIKDKSGQKETIVASRVYLAAGPISSAKILLKSLNMYEEELIIRNSDMYYIPSLLLKPACNVTNERLITTSLFSMLLFDNAISKYTIGMHCYYYSELYRDILNNLFGVAKRPASAFINMFLDRFFMIFAFLHSNESSHLSAALDIKKNILIIKGINNPNKYSTEQRIRKKLRQIKKLTGFVPFPFYRDRNLPGSSIHSGASFPMGNKSDILGRPESFKRLHVVDATILPDIPSGSFTFTIMANAYRIGEESL
jgi:choline dehydrogenase-like flavoprotein